MARRGCRHAGFGALAAVLSVAVCVFAGRRASAAPGHEHALRSTAGLVTVHNGEELGAALAMLASPGPPTTILVDGNIAMVRFPPRVAPGSGGATLWAAAHPTPCAAVPPCGSPRAPADALLP